MLKFSFSEMATKICVICLMVYLVNVKTIRQIAANFCGLLRKADLYILLPDQNIIGWKESFASRTDLVFLFSFPDEQRRL